jgi:hypothetical protein
MILENHFIRLNARIEVSEREICFSFFIFFFFIKGTRLVDGEDLSFRDEPVVRYLNIVLTEFVERVCCEPIVHAAGLSVSVMIEGGKGFEAHTDTSPPFDLTLDLVVGHSGERYPEKRFSNYYARKNKCLSKKKKKKKKSRRPIFLCPANSLSVKEVSCGVGESVLFRGAEISHYGGQLPAGNTHAVSLLSWTFCRD